MILHSKLIRFGLAIFTGLLALVLLALGLVYISAPIENLRTRIDYTPIDSSKLRQTGLTSKGFVPLSKMSSYLVLAVIVGEDAKFFEHHGFDFSEMKEAIEAALTGASRLRGASTLSQQLIKNIYFGPRRTLLRKLLEAVYTIKLEQKFSKTEILSLYLNCAQFGQGLYGVNQAAKFFFDKSAADLDIPEAAFLAALLPNPSLRLARIDSGQLSPELQSAFVVRLRKIYAVLAELDLLESSNQPSIVELESVSVNSVVAKLITGQYKKAGIQNRVEQDLRSFVVAAYKRFGKKEPIGQF